MLVDLLKSIDYGGYYFFRHAVGEHPEIAPPMQLGQWLSSYPGVGITLLLAVIISLLQKRTRAAQISLAAFVLGVIFVEMLPNVVPANRPADAQLLVATDEMSRSFPAQRVFLFTMAGFLLLFAAWGSVKRAMARLLLSAGLVSLILWVALSPLVLGLHYVTDVMGGLFGGLALALLASRFSAMAEPVFSPGNADR